MVISQLLHVLHMHLRSTPRQIFNKFIPNQNVFSIAPHKMREQDTYI